jgi:hypothetical protein
MKQLGNIVTVYNSILFKAVTQEYQPWTRKVTQAKAATKSRRAATALVEDDMENHHPGKLGVTTR